MPLVGRCKTSLEWIPLFKGFKKGPSQCAPSDSDPSAGLLVVSAARCGRFWIQLILGSLTNRRLNYLVVNMRSLTGQCR